MVDQSTPPAFPHEDALCEACGYPLKGLPFEGSCPECGLPVAESSPAKRIDLMDDSVHTFVAFWRRFATISLAPRLAFRRLRMDAGNDSPQAFLTRSCFFASAVWAILIAFLIMSASRGPLYMWLVVLGVQFALMMFVLHALTYIEMIGVTAFSKRRGWRVPFVSARRICCYSSVGWLPCTVVAAGGAIGIEYFFARQFWFESFLGLIKVRWLFYVGLFFVSVLWFETLVWIGVRQVRYANHLPQAHGVDASETSGDAVGSIADAPTSAE